MWVNRNLFLVFSCQWLLILFVRITIFSFFGKSVGGLGLSPRVIFLRIRMHAILVKIEQEVYVFEQSRIRIELDGGRVTLDGLVGIFVLGHESLLIEFSFQNLVMLRVGEEWTGGQIIVWNFSWVSVDNHALICQNVRILVDFGYIRLITEVGTIRVSVLIIFILVSDWFNWLSFWSSFFIIVEFHLFLFVLTTFLEWLVRMVLRVLVAIKTSGFCFGFILVCQYIRFLAWHWNDIFFFVHTCRFGAFKDISLYS